jgi:hypothetical protein
MTSRWTLLAILATPCDTARMTVTDQDEERAVRLVLADVTATVGPSGEPIVQDIARWLRQFVNDPVEYLERLVADTQQEFHDRYIDTDWPKCPLHDGRHPLWLGEGGWCCQQDGVLIAAIGDLGSRVGANSP